MKDDNIIKLNLKNLGLTNNEINIYLFLFSVWKSPASNIANRTNIKRVTAYAALDTLEDKWLITKIKINNIQLFSCLDPEKLTDIFSKRINQERVKLAVAEKIIPFLQEIRWKNVSKPKVSFFEWTDWILSIFQESLQSKSEIKAFITTKNISPKLLTYLNTTYARLRKKHWIFSKVIATKKSFTIEYQKKDKDELRETKLIPENILEIDTEIDIFDDKVAFLWVKEEDEIWVLIQNESIANTMRKIFDTIWSKY